MPQSDTDINPGQHNKSHPREAKSHFEIVDPKTWYVVRAGRHLPIMKRFQKWVGPFAFYVDGVSYEAYARYVRCAESQQMFFEDWGIPISSERDSDTSEQSSVGRVKSEVDATTFHNGFANQIRQHPQEAKSHFDIVDPGVWHCTPEPLRLSGERIEWEGPFAFILNGVEYYAYGRKGRWRASAQAFLCEWGFDDSGSPINVAKSPRHGLSTEAKMWIAMSILIFCAVVGWLCYRSNNSDVRGRTNDSPQAVTPSPEAIDEFNKLYARVENRRLAHEAKKKVAMRGGIASGSKETRRSVPQRPNGVVSRKDNPTQTDHDSQSKNKQKASCNKELKKGAEGANKVDEDLAFDETSDIVVPLLVGCVTFALSWILLRLIFRPTRDLSKK